MVSTSVKTIVDKITSAIIDPLVFLLFAAGFLFFLWGLMVFMWKSDSDEGRDTGKRHMIWGIFGMFIIVVAYGIISFIQNTLGV